MNMVGTNPLTYQSDKTAAKSVVGKKSSIQLLITLERAQKLDLLIHLVANLRQSLVLCGPVGIGKSTLLEVLETKAPDSWLVCSITATKQLSFERIQAELLTLFQDNNNYSADLHESLQRHQKLNKKIVLIIDDAGLLVPGLITELCQFALTYSQLRIIFALTPDELHIINSSDKIIEDCHFIDIPPLTEKQCGEFLQNLSTKPGAKLSLEAISAGIIDKIYRESHGIPGKIVAMQMGITRIKSSRRMTWLYVLVFSVLIIAGGRMFLLEKSNEQAELVNNNVTSVISTKKGQIEIFPPIVNQIPDTLEQETVEVKQQNSEPEINTPIIQKTADIELAPISTQDQPQESIALGKQDFESKGLKQIPIVEHVELEKTINLQQLESQEIIKVERPDKIQPEKSSTIIDELPEADKIEKAYKNTELKKQQLVASPKMPNIKPVINEEKSSARDFLLEDGVPWIFGQPKKNYTLQLMSVEKQKSLVKVIKKYPDMQSNFHIYKSQKKSKTRFVLLYGSFDNTKLASKSIMALPAAFKPPWKRRFRTIQKEIKTNSAQ
jgi:DamX protein